MPVVTKSRKVRRAAPQAAAPDKTRTELGLSWMPLPVTQPEAPLAEPELLSREDFSKRAPWEMLAGDEPGTKRGEVPLAPGDVAGAGILLRRVGAMRPGVIKFLRRVTSGKAGEMLRKLVPSLKLEGGTLSYADKEVQQLVDAMKRLGAPGGLTTIGDFTSGGGNVRYTLHDLSMAQRMSDTPGRAIQTSSGGHPLISMKPPTLSGFTRGMQTDSEAGAPLDYVDDIRRYVSWLEKNNPARLAQLIREQGEIARTQPFRPGPLLPFEEGGPRPGMYPGEPRMPARPSD